MEQRAKAGFTAFFALLCAWGARAQPSISSDPALVRRHVNVELRAIHAALGQLEGRQSLLLFTSSLPESSSILVDAELISPMSADELERFRSFTRAQGIVLVCSDVRVFLNQHLPTTSSHFSGKARRCRLEPTDP